MRNLIIILSVLTVVSAAIYDVREPLGSAICMVGGFVFGYNLGGILIKAVWPGKNSNP